MGETQGHDMLVTSPGAVQDGHLKSKNYSSTLGERWWWLQLDGSQWTGRWADQFEIYFVDRTEESVGVVIGG